MARREERAYREYVSDEQRSQAGCIGGQSGTVSRGRVLSRAAVVLSACLRSFESRLPDHRLNLGVTPTHVCVADVHLSRR
jgi:hypothetical protein